MDSIWFWQQLFTPHMAYLADQLAADGLDTVYVASQLISTERRQLGWSPPTLKKVRVMLAPDHDTIDSLLASAPQDSIHLCEGLRASGLMAHAQRQLIANRIKPWILMEMVDDAGISGFARRQVYRQILRRNQNNISGILAIGHQTPEWLIRLGLNPQSVIPFTYFLPEVKAIPRSESTNKRPFQVLFVGQLIKRKRVDLLFKAVAVQQQDVHVTIIGDGCMRPELQRLAESLLPNRVNWLGRLPI